MTSRMEFFIWVTTALMGGAAAWIIASRGDIPATQMRPFSMDGNVHRDSAQPGHDAREIVASDPFRIDREPAELPFTLDSERASPAVTSVSVSAQKPILALRAVVGGPPWEALIDGVPGSTGSVRIRPGDRLGVLTIGPINENLVIVHGMDTTWRLAMVRPWQ